MHFLLSVNPNLRKFVLPTLPAPQSPSAINSPLPPTSVPTRRQFLPKEIRRETVACVSAVKKEANSSYPITIMEARRLIQSYPLVPDFYHQQFGIHALLHKCPGLSIVKTVDLHNVSMCVNPPAPTKLYRRKPPMQTVERTPTKLLLPSQTVESCATQLPSDSRQDVAIASNMTHSVREQAHLATINIGQCGESELLPVKTTGLLRTSSEILLSTRTDREVQSIVNQRRSSLSSVDMIDFFNAQKPLPRKVSLDVSTTDGLSQNTKSIPAVSGRHQLPPRAASMFLPQPQPKDIEAILRSLSKEKAPSTLQPFKHIQDVPRSVPYSNLPSSFSVVLGTSQGKGDKKTFLRQLTRRSLSMAQREQVHNPYPDLVISGTQVETLGGLSSLMEEVIEDTCEVEQRLRRARRK